MNKKLQKQIESRLDKLQGILDQIQEAQIIVAHEPDTWDADTLYNLEENLKEALKLLEDKPLKGKYDEFGQPLYEEGLCSLVEEYKNENQEEENYD